ncbi:MAG TPA: DUF4097 family beta strand repeat-containing protein [Chryseolinea sp.]|nr:DUF4097 family beta strand repeat-containing protein [Chryseolinea sp.]
MKLKNAPFNLIALAALLLPLTLLAQKDVTKTFSGIKKIRMGTASGSCVITKSGNATVKVDLKYTYDDDDYTPSFDQQGDVLVVKEKFHNNSSNGSADWKLTVPDNLSIEFTTGSGDVEASGLALDLDATTGSGDFTFTGTTGEIECTTGSGDIELENVGGTIKATSGSGGFRVKGAKGKFHLTTGSGSHRISESVAELKITTGSGNINCAGITLEGPSTFSTGSGTAEVQLAASPKHDLSISSGSGDAIANFSGHEINGEIVMKASKKHGNIDAPFAFDKTEEINHSNSDVTIQKTAVRGTGKPRISISTGSGDAVLKK